MGNACAKIKSLPSHDGTCISGALFSLDEARATEVKECSSTGRAPVSKTGGWGFEPLHSCHFIWQHDDVSRGHLLFTEWAKEWAARP